MSAQQNTQVKKYGIFDPLSTAGPSEADLRNDEALRRVLVSHNLFEPESESQKREEVLGKLYAIAREWVKQCSLAKVFLDISWKYLKTPSAYTKLTLRRECLSS
jgi:poly(A) polymerase Pap1